MDINTKLEEAAVETNTSGNPMDIPGLLRKLGAAAVLVSFTAFLFKGWAGTNDLVKYGLLFGSTISISVVAMFIAQLFREGKGPRLLMSLSLVAVPINFTILGAFVFYAASLSAGITYPDYLAWTIADWPTAIAVTVGSGLLLLPVILLGFRTLARPISTRLSVFFVASNLMLLVPVRDVFFVTVVGITLTIITLYITSASMREEISARTFEGKLAMLVQFLPLGILLGRNLWLYPSHDAVLLVIMAAIFVAVRQISLLCERDGISASTLNFVSMLPMMFIMTLLEDVLSQAGAGSASAFYFAALTGAALTYEVSTRTETSKSLFRLIAGLLLVGGSFTSLMMFGNALIACGVLVSGIALIVASAWLEQKALGLTGVALAIMALIDLTIQALALFDIASWFTLLIAGIIAIVAASAIETHGAGVKRVLAKQRKDLEAWEF